MKTLSLTFVLFAFSGPAFAHTGAHGHLDLAGLLAHIFEPDHLIFACIAALVGVLAYRAGRRAEARVQARQDKSHDPR